MAKHAAAYKAPTGSMERKDGLDGNRLMSWEQAGYPRPIDHDHATVLHKVLASWANPFLERGIKV